MDSSQNIKTYTDIFYDALPYYLSIGMTTSEFWEGNVYLVEAFRKANLLKKKQINEFMYLQGLYTYHAFGTVISNVHFDKKHHKVNNYLSEPIDVYLTEEEREQKQKERDELERQKVIAYLKALQKNWENKKKRGTEDGTENR